MSCGDRPINCPCAATSHDSNCRKLRSLDLEPSEQATEVPAPFLPKSPLAYTVDADDIARMFSYPSPPPAPPVKQMRPSRLAKPEGFLLAMKKQRLLSTDARSPSGSGLYGGDYTPHSPRTRGRSPRHGRHGDMVRPDYRACRLDAYRTPSPSPAPMGFGRSLSSCQTDSSSSRSPVFSPYKITGCKRTIEVAAMVPPSPGPSTTFKPLGPPSPIPLPMTEGSVDESSPRTPDRACNASKRARPAETANLAAFEQPLKKARTDAVSRTHAIENPSTATGFSSDRYETCSQCSDNMERVHSSEWAVQRMPEQHSSRHVTLLGTPDHNHCSRNDFERNSDT